MVPVISVVIAVYNGERYIGETLNSLIHQRFSEWDCWIVDDGSSDGTCAIVEAFQRKDKRFNLVRTGGGNGPYIAANIGIDHCKGEYVARIDADDICLPERLSLQKEALDAHSEKNICCSEHYNMFSDGRLLHKKLMYSMEEWKYYLMFKNPFLHSSMFFRREWFQRIGKYPEKRLAQDYFMWCYSILENELVIVRQPLVKWRLNDLSLTKKESQRQTDLAIDVNHWYLAKLFKQDVDYQVSRLFFGTFRGFEKIEGKLLVEALTLLFKAERNLFHGVMPGDMRISILYDLLYTHLRDWKTSFKILVLFLRYDPRPLYSLKFFKLYYKLCLNLRK